MKRLYLFILLMLICMVSFAQTKIAKEQIEDAFIQKSGGPVYGDLSAATSTIHAASFSLTNAENVFEIICEEPYSVIRSNKDLLFDPTNDGVSGARILFATVAQFSDKEGDKIRFYSHSYAIGVSSYTLDITSDRHIKFHSDTVPDLLVIWGDDGDVDVKRDLKSGRDVIAANTFQFSPDSTGDKILLYGTLYRIAVSANTVDFYSDRDFSWHSDSITDAMHLNADTGKLAIQGPLNLGVYTALPAGEIGDVIYFDHQTDDLLDGVYVYCSTGWQQL
jgi:hypothetical protein